MGGKRSMTVYNTDIARGEANKIIGETGNWEDEFLDYYSQEDRRKLVRRINEQIDYHEKGNSIDAEVCNKDGGGG